MKIKWNKVTWYSWALAGIIFLVVVPLLTFYFVGQYQDITALNILNNSPVNMEQSTVSSNTKTNTQVDGDVSWKIYKNKKYGFQFEYPSNLIIEESFDEWDTTNCDTMGAKLHSANVVNLWYPSNSNKYEYIKIWVTNLCNLGHFSDLQTYFSQNHFNSYYSTSTLVHGEKSYVVQEPFSRSVYFQHGSVFIVDIDDMDKFLGIQGLNQIENHILASLHFN